MNRLRQPVHNCYHRITLQYRSDLVWAWAHDHITTKLARVCVAAREQMIYNLACIQRGTDRWYLTWHKACHIKLSICSENIQTSMWIILDQYFVLYGYSGLDSVLWPRFTVPSNHSFRNCPMEAWKQPILPIYRVNLGLQTALGRQTPPTWETDRPCKD